MAQKTQAGWILSAQDVVAQYECDHKVELRLATQLKLIEKPNSDNPELELLVELGNKHEQKLLEKLKETNSVTELPGAVFKLDEINQAWAETQQAMESGVDFIYQATLFTGDVVGYVDFMKLAKDRDGNAITENGRFVYEPVDAKSARSAKPKAVLQVGFYAETMVRLGLPRPKQVHLWLAGDKTFSGDAEKPMSLARELREQLQQRLQSEISLPNPVWGAPVAACISCDWKAHCELGRRTDRDLSLVQGMRASARKHLIDSGVSTIDSLAVADESLRPPRLRQPSFEKLRDQALLQVQAETKGEILWKIADPNALSVMPPRSAGDIWFDMEGDPYAFDGRGLEYMFGWTYLDESGSRDFDKLWGHDQPGEKKAFEDFIDHVLRTWSDHPGMHVYHYADYERKTLLRLSQQYATRELELDQILRHGLLVDLYSLIKQAFRFSTESLSIKYIEEVYGVSHKQGDVSSAMGSVIQYENYVALLKTGDPASLKEAAQILQSIEDYNKLDCDSTLELDSWIRAKALAHGIDTNLSSVSSETEIDPIVELNPLVTALRAGIDIEPSNRTASEQAKALLASSVEFFAREKRPAWWALFDLMKSDAEEINRASGALVVGDGVATTWDKTPRARKLRRTVTLSGQSQDPADIFNPSGDVFLVYENPPNGMSSLSDSNRGYQKAKILSISGGEIEVEEMESQQGTVWEQIPMAVIPGPPIPAGPIEQRLELLAQQVIDAGSIPTNCWGDILQASPPRIEGGLRFTDNTIDDVTESLMHAENSYVAVQGPPGTGKTYLGSRVVASLAKAGWKIAVVAQSHTVVENFLEKVHEVDPSVALGKAPKSGTKGNPVWEVDKAADWASSQEGGFVIGGTSWTMVSAGVVALGLDLMVIDEAGQLSLPMTIATASVAKNVLMLGDPQQLPQVSQAQHPEGAEIAALEHIAGGHPTLPKDRGYFLETTFRMHPALTEKVSVLQYEGKLVSHPSTSERMLEGVLPGVIPVTVSHQENTTSSPEEAKQIAELVASLMGKSWQASVSAAPKELDEGDFLIVAAFNDQVRTIKKELSKAGFGSIQVGTVDKFQGREAAVAIISMATSSDEELPRGIDFLLNPNRLNVAISRGQWCAYIVHSPRLKRVQPSSITGMYNLGGLIGLLEL